jgi:hypothetical protein
MAFCLSSAKAAAIDTNGFRLVVELRDGSKLVGKAGNENYQFRSDVLGEMKLPLERIRSIECQPGTTSIKLTTSNGDVLSAQFAMKEIRIEAAFGNVRLPANLLKQIQVSPVGGPSKNHSGLVALWSGEGNGSDLAGGNNATLMDVSFADGKTGRAFVFNGQTSQITVPASASLAVSNLTFEGWIFSTDPGRPRPIIEYGGSGQNVGISLWLNTQGGTSLLPGALYACVRDQSRAGFNFIEVKSTPGIVPLNQWTHVAFTFDAETRAGILYCNGIQVGAATSPGMLVPQGFMPVNLGYRDANSNDIMQGYRFAGLLDEIAIYNRPLSAEEIRNTVVEGNHGEPLSPPAPKM